MTDQYCRRGTRCHHDRTEIPCHVLERVIAGGYRLGLSQARQVPGDDAKACLQSSARVPPLAAVSTPPMREDDAGSVRRPGFFNSEFCPARPRDTLSHEAAPEDHEEQDPGADCDERTTMPPRIRLRYGFVHRRIPSLRPDPLYPAHAAERRSARAIQEPCSTDEQRERDETE
jgi:hypothetical protein